ncbi:MAG: hypothetical protein HY226_03655 [Candidatus Vogelbacteria bacterium]|nr:hypothetical protein [Candidatus Vogelbacteria bacterium]
MTLKDFLRWYKRPERTDGDNIHNPEQFKTTPYTTGHFQLLKNAPDGIPDSIDMPEILVPQIIPQKYIRVLE